MGGSGRTLILAVAAGCAAAGCAGDTRPPVDPCAGGACDADAGGGADAGEGEGEGQCCATDGPAWIEVGVGESDFQPLPADGQVMLELGLQGAWMTLLAMRGEGFAPERTRLFVEARLGGDRVAQLGSETDFAPEDGVLEAAGLALVFYGDINIMTMVGQTLDLEARLTDAAGTTLGASELIVPRM